MTSTNKRRFKFQFKKKQEEKKLLKLLGYNLKKQRFDHYYKNYKKFNRHFLKLTKRFQIENMLNLNEEKKNQKTVLILKNNIETNNRNLEFMHTMLENIKEIKGYDKKKVKKLIGRNILSLYKKITKKRRIALLNKLFTRIRKFRRIIRRKSNLKLRRRRKKIYNRKIFNLIMRHSNNNFFITLTDPLNNVIWNYSSGRVFGQQRHNIKRKRSHLMVDDIVRVFDEKLSRVAKFKYVKLIIKSNVTRHMYKIVNFIRKKNFVVIKVAMRKPMPHHKGDRRKKLKRR